MIRTDSNADWHFVSVCPIPQAHISPHPLKGSDGRKERKGRGKEKEGRESLRSGRDRKMRREGNGRRGEKMERKGGKGSVPTNSKKLIAERPNDATCH